MRALHRADDLHELVTICRQWRPSLPASGRQEEAAKFERSSRVAAGRHAQRTRSTAAGMRHFDPESRPQARKRKAVLKRLRAAKRRKRLKN
jgi:hypothetical protein